MQRALKVQVMNHVMRRQLNLGESGIREQKLVQDGMTSNPFDYGMYYTAASLKKEAVESVL